MLALVLAAAACGGRGGGSGLSAEAAHFAKVIRAPGARLDVSGHSCSGLYGVWTVRLDVHGAVSGTGETEFTLQPGREASAPISFAIRAGVLSGRARALLRVRSDDGALAVRGTVRASVAFKSVSRDLDLRIPVTRGPTPECGLSAGVRFARDG